MVALEWVTIIFTMTPHATYRILTGNEAAATMAYAVNDLCILYPITPSTEMSTLVAEQAEDGKRNILQEIPETFEMQSEAGVAGALHGALQTGSLATTFTSSQGLLLMLPNLYKIAGELTPCVIHVATRSLATHALSVFGDHSDVMAIRQSGFGLIASSSVQEAHDLALIAQASSLESRIPLVHFFDGFRTSHEFSKIATVPETVIAELIPHEAVSQHRTNALNPNRPVVRGTAQGPDTYFQSREAQNTFYLKFPEVLRKVMNKFASLTGRTYQPFEYHGHPEATDVIVVMGSAFHTACQASDHMNRMGKRTGVINVRLYRPFAPGLLREVLPETCRRIAVLDRTKEPGSAGEPLYLDVVSAFQNTTPVSPSITGGRYGLASRDFTPEMACDLFISLASDSLRNGFTVGIRDDLTGLSVPAKTDHLSDSLIQELLLLENDSPACKTSFTSLMNSLGTGAFVQGYREISYEKGLTTARHHIRLGENPFHAPYLIRKPGLIVCENAALLGDQVLHHGQTVLLAEFTQADVTRLQQHGVTVGRIPSMIPEPGMTVTQSLLLHAVRNPERIQPLSVAEFREPDQRVNVTEITEPVNLIDYFLSGKRNDIPVSVLPADGSYPSGVTDRIPGYGLKELPGWNPDACTQCGLCSAVCPQAALRMKVYDPETDVPAGFKHLPSEEFPGFDFTIGINPDQCNGCNLCVEACGTDALTPEANDSPEQWPTVSALPELDRRLIDPSRVRQQQFQEPLFKYPRSIQGCSESIYMKLLSQLFGDRLLIANSTGTSSILGGAMPLSPWAQDEHGRGPAWSNSLFEDTAEFGLGFRLSLDRQAAHARKQLRSTAAGLDEGLINQLLNNPQKTEHDIYAQRKAVNRLRTMIDNPRSGILRSAEHLVRRDVWVVGGDGWAFDIGFGGLDHLMASGKNVNVLVLDNELYSNTGGQQSKSTPYGATANLAPGGKKESKKPLAEMMMNYRNVYVASVSVGADADHTLKALNEAADYNGPSLVIAYCHSPEHGISDQQYLARHKMAVASGQWPLYRYHPDRSPRLSVDSPAPSVPLTDYLRGEKRFDQMSAEELEGAHRMVRAKVDYLMNLAGQPEQEVTFHP